jgi:phosphatidylethanolamine-binding protein (PEBP) family uncharacterized protein
MRTKKRLVNELTVALVGAGLLALGCSSETTDGGTGGAGSGGAAGSTAGTTPTGGTSSGMSGTGGTTAGSSSGGTSGATTGGSSGAGATGGGGTSAGAGAGGAGAGGSGTGGAGQAGMPMGGAGSGGMSGGAAGSGGRGGAGGGGGGAGGGGGGASGFRLTSPDHTEGAMFAAPYTCDNPMGFSGSILPELNWSGAPSGTMSFAITFIDRTLAARGELNGYHWVIWNIPATTMMLPEAFKDQTSIGAQENGDFLGPCPNFGGGSANTDTYEFTIYALAQASITVSPATGTMAVRNAEMALEANNLAKTKLSGTSNASP